MIPRTIQLCLVQDEMALKREKPVEEHGLREKSTDIRVKQMRTSESGLDIGDDGAYSLYIIGPLPVAGDPQNAGHPEGNTAPLGARASRSCFSAPSNHDGITPR